MQHLLHKFCRRYCHPVVVLPGLLLLLLSGCGGSKYEERVARTSQFYDYLTSMNASLSPAWIRRDLGLSMRPPFPFKSPMSGPPVQKDQLGKEVIGLDPRQETPLGVPLPGLEEAWAGNLDTSKMEPDIWMYVLTNHSRLKEEADGGRPANEFLIDLERELMSVFQVTIPDGETSQPKDNIRYKAKIPSPSSPSANYTTPQDFSVIHFVGELPVQDQELSGLLYARRVDKTQVAILVILPKDAPLAFRQRLELALATLSVDNVAVSRKNSGSSRQPGAPGKAAPNF